MDEREKVSVSPDVSALYSLEINRTPSRKKSLNLVECMPFNATAVFALFR